MSFVVRARESEMDSCLAMFVLLAVECHYRYVGLRSD